MQRKLYLALIPAALLFFSCFQNGKQETKETNGTKTYATAQLDLASLSQSYSKSIEDILKKDQTLPDKVKEALTNIKSFLNGESANPYNAIKAVEFIESYQNKHGIHFFSDERLNKLRVFVKRKAQYAQPAVG